MIGRNSSNIFLTFPWCFFLSLFSNLFSSLFIRFSCLLALNLWKKNKCTVTMLINKSASWKPTKIVSNCQQSIGARLPQPIWTSKRFQRSNPIKKTTDTELCIVLPPPWNNGFIKSVKKERRNSKIFHCLCYHLSPSWNFNGSFILLMNYLPSGLLL